MIPEFPQFKNVELTDRVEVEKLTSGHPPYSDFSFASIWAWDIKGEMGLSVLYGNLVIRFTDYLTGKPFYSFLGKNKVNETVGKLLDLSKHEGLKVYLKLVPEDSIKGIDLVKFEVKEDRDHFDYIYNLKELYALSGGKFSKKRNQVSLFLKNYPNAIVKQFDLNDKNFQGSIMNLFLEWMRRKMEKEEVYESHEEVAVNRLLLAIDACHLIGVGVFIDEKMIGFFVNELTATNYVVAHASKLNKSFSGINSYLMRENAGILATLGKEFFNYEQDLGMENLRDAKTRFRQCTFLKKYQLTYRQP